MKFVLDSDVFVDSCRPQGGASYELMAKIAQGQLRPYCSPELYLDYVVAMEWAAQNQEIGLTEKEATELVESFTHHMDEVDMNQMYLAQAMIDTPLFARLISTAESAGAEFIVTNRPEAVKAALGARLIQTVRPEDVTS